MGGLVEDQSEQIGELLESTKEKEKAHTRDHLVYRRRGPFLQDASEKKGALSPRPMNSLKKLIRTIEGKG